MGDMKTPDFDDLLAAFDIPDATGLDAKESSQENHEETEGQLKHTICLDDGLSVHQAVGAADVPVVSVIVKNTSRQESLEGLGDGLHSEPPLQNGFRGPESSDDSNQLTNSGFSKPFESTLNGDDSQEPLGKSPIQQKPEGTPTFSQSFSQFSPISSPESEDTQSSQVDACPRLNRLYFPDASLLVEPLISDNQKKVSPTILDESPDECDTPGNALKSKAEAVDADNAKAEEPAESCTDDQKDKADRENGTSPLRNDNHNGVECNSNTAAKPNPPTSHPYVESRTSKLSSCLEALVALNARNGPTELSNFIREPSVVLSDCMKVGPKVPISPRSPRSPLEAVRRLIKPSDSPVSICSDSSGKASPAMPAGSPPAIPRVRIKTIKTTSGQIKRTVTSVLPDSETDDVQSTCESSPSQSIISEDSYCNMSPHQSQPAAGDVGAGTPVKTTPTGGSSSKGPHGKSEGHSRKPGAMQSPAVFHNVGGPLKRPVVQLGHKLKRIPSAQVAPAAPATNTNLLPKAMHLANLNLVPHSVAATAAQTRPAPHTLPPSTVCSTVPLVHQVKPANPPPRPSVPNTAAGTLSRLLNNANPVPTYVPNLSPPPNSGIRLPARGFCCLECGDSFGVERSLVCHYGRRSVHIEVACTHCAKTIVFFNKCALLAHAREHKNGGVVMQCTQLHMKPIAQDQMFAPADAESSSVSSVSSVSSSSAAGADSSASPAASPRGQPVMPLYPDNVIRHRLRCLECSKQLSDYRALAGHYQRSSEDMEGLICKVCSMLLPNKCSFRAHQRIHAHKSPYCCPECGALSRSADIQKHVKENCLHYSRKAGYKCLHCETVFKTINGQKNHIEEKHCEVFYKCSICPVAFKSTEGCDAHMKNKHNASKTAPQLIFKCSCETVFKKKQLLIQHFHQGANKRVTCVFKCPECNSVFPQKHLLMQHFKTAHGGIFRAEAERNSQPVEKSSQHQDASPSAGQPKVHSPVKHAEPPRKKLDPAGVKPRPKPTAWTCGECIQWFPDRDAYVSHMKRKHGKSLKRYPCRQCERSFNSSTSLRRHIRNDHNGNKKSYTCWYCTDSKTIFTASVMLKNHISLMHGIKNPDLSLMPKATVQESKSLGGGLPAKRPATDTQGGGRKNHTAPRDAPSPAKRPKTQFRCSKCGFATEDSVQFQQHIPQHRTDENAPQCVHCGLCFTSAVSLSRHLFIVHKIKDPQEETGPEAPRAGKKKALDHLAAARSAEPSEVGGAIEKDRSQAAKPPPGGAL